MLYNPTVASSNSDSVGDYAAGSIYIYDPALKSPPSPYANGVFGSVYSLMSDSNGHVLVNHGSQGLSFTNLLVNPHFTTSIYEMIPPGSPQTHHGILHFLKKIAYGVVKDTVKDVEQDAADAISEGIEDAITDILPALALAV